MIFKKPLEEDNLAIKILQKLKMLLNQLNKHLMMLKNYQIQLVKLYRTPKIKDKNVLLIQLMLNMLQNKLKMTQELLNGTYKKLYLYYIKLKQENKQQIGHQLQLQLKVQLILMGLFHYLDHWEDGKKIPQILEIT